ncbi:MAG: RIP metalloprotease RseP [Methylophaga sp.]|nr:MAG: RIP metalloprotease RseP [Methylophaga sp.]
MQSLFFFIVALSILVVIHEFGHFWVARRCGVKVLKFSVGFGQPLFKKLGRDGTEYILAAIPLGGYVKMLDEREGSVPPEQLDQAFNNKSLAARTAIIAAGPIANLLFAIFAYWLIFIMGIPGMRPIIDEIIVDSPASYAEFRSGDEITQINGTETPTWSSVRKALFKISQSGGTAEIRVNLGDIEVQRQLEIAKIDLDSSMAKPFLNTLGLIPIQIKYKPVIGSIIRGGAAEKAGLKEGDELRTYEGDAISSWAEWVTLIRAHADIVMPIEIQRENKTIALFLTPSKTTDNIGKIGAGLDASKTKIPDYLQAELRYSPLYALRYAVQETWDFSSSTVKGIVGMLMGTVSSKNIGGPITIAQIAGASAEQGLIAFIYFLAMISVSLGILNLLPIPILDGGHLLMNLIEWVKGTALSEQAQLRSQKVGIILLLSLMFLAFFNDLTRLFGS